MTPGDVRRAFIQSAVVNAIRDLKRAPHQTVRRLVDWGCQFATGAFQKTFFSNARSFLERDDSPYHVLLRNLVRWVNPLSLRTFSINLGYNAWTLGAGMIRSEESRIGHGIPWIVRFSDVTGHGALTVQAMEQVIEEGERMGIFAYYAEVQEADALDCVCELAARHSDSVFWVLAAPDVIAMRDTRVFSDIYNLMVVVRRSDGWETLCRNLMSSGVLVSLCVPYAAADEILRGEWRSDVRESGVPVCFFEASESAGEEDRRRVAEYARAEREHPSVPVFVCELAEDILEVERIISGEPCLVSVEDSGQAFSFDSGHRRTTRWQNGFSFSSMLRTLAPRVRRTI